MLDSRQARTSLREYTAFIMKGSVGVATSVPGVGRASVGSRGATRSFGVSLSPEARPSSGPATFSSKGLARYNEALSRTVNINHGKDGKFATNNGAWTRPSIFDISKPVSKDVVARSAHKAAYKSPIRIPGKVVEVKTIVVAPQKKTETRPDPFKNTVILWQRTPDRIAPVAPKQIERRAVKREIVKAAPERIFAKREIISQQTQIKDAIHKPSPFIKEQIAPRVRVHAKSETARAYRLDVMQAQRTARVMTSVGFSEAHIQHSLQKTLIQRYEGKPGVEIAPEQKTQTETKTKPTVLPAVHSKTVEQGATPPTEEEKKKPKEEKEEEGILFFFKLYKEAKAKRVSGVVDAVKKLFSYKKEGEIVTGKEVAYELSKNTSTDVESEVSLTIRPDGTWKGFMQKIATIGAITDPELAEAEAERISKEEKAVKLSLSDTGEDVGREGAIRVYEGPLHGQKAFFKENGGAFGKFKDGKNSNQIWFIPTIDSPVSLRG